MSDLTIDDLAEDVESQFSVDFRDPFAQPYGDPERTTESQEKLWTYLREYDVWRQATIGGKGSGKSHYGAAFSFYFGQQFPGAVGACIANTDRQAKDAAGEHFMNVADMLGYQAEYFKSKKMGGQEQSKFYVVDLDDEGFDIGQRFMLKVRSLEAVKAMEGSEFDFVWFEELQDATRKPFVKAQSRNRGTHIAGPDKRNPVFLAGMTQGSEHWLYSMLEESMDFKTGDEFDPETGHSVLLEPTLDENKKNIGQAKYEEYLNTFSATEAERLVHARRVSHNSDRALFEYRENKHTKGRMSKILCRYDPYAELIMSMDFNISPMCTSLWQVKDWNDKWDNDNVQIVWSETGQRPMVDEVRVWHEDDGGEPVYDSYETLHDFAPPNAEVLAQVDEYEVWPRDTMGGGTEGLMRHFVSDYQDHGGEIVITGDAQGHSRQSASSKTDWDIVREYANKIPGAVVIPGLESSDDVTGPVRWSNPNVKDTINNANRLLKNANGKARICFMPDSEYPSGGVSASVSATERDGKGGIDERRDRSEDREKPRTHWLDTVRYVCWFFTDGSSMSADEFENAVDDLEEVNEQSFGQLPEGMDPDRYIGEEDEDDSLSFGGETDLLF